MLCSQNSERSIVILSSPVAYGKNAVQVKSNFNGPLNRCGIELLMDQLKVEHNLAFKLLILLPQNHVAKSLLLIISFLFQVMVYVIDHVLPTNYFANNLRALSVDMAVLRDLMRAKLSRLSKHLDSLQAQALSQNGSSAMYEPPLINVFTMQWFLTLFATCLPEETVLRVWDSILLEGSEVLLRAAVAIWGKLGGYLSTFL